MERCLSEKQVIDIIKNTNNLTVRDLAKKHNISIFLISKIQTGKLYADIAADIPRRKVDKTRSIHTKPRPLFLKQEFKRKLLDPNRAISVSALARQYGVPKSAAFLIKKGAKWKNIIVSPSQSSTDNT